MYDVDDADLIELYETWLRQQAAGTDPGRKMFYIGPTIMMENFNENAGPMPNVISTLPNIGGVLCSTAQSLADAHY